MTRAARDIVRAQKAAYPDAAHVVHAFIAGDKAEVQGMSDDGEPGGTAGRPVLDVLSGSGLTNLVLTVTRYFGGTLLGTGGLVRAYTAAAQSVISECTAVPLVRYRALEFAPGYGAYERVSRSLAALGSLVTADFAEAVTLKVKVPLPVWKEALAIAAPFIVDCNYV